MTTSDKYSARAIARFALVAGIRDVVVSPGSRSAPLVIAFQAHAQLRLHLVVDERSAGFVALGIYQAKRVPVLLCCTSGTALLNYAPAMAEAFYQDACLIVVSADRPDYIIDKGDGQTIRQPGVFDNFCRHSCHLPHSTETEQERQTVMEKLQRAFSLANTHPIGPIHINVPFEEPLYRNIVSEELVPMGTISPSPTTNDIDFAPWLHTLTQYRRCLLLLGQIPGDAALSAILTNIAAAHKAVVVGETLSNLDITGGIFQIDRTLSAASHHAQLAPDLVLSIGTNIVSKRIKEFLRNIPGLVHWHIDEGHRPIDTFGALQAVLPFPPVRVLQAFETAMTSMPKYVVSWQSAYLSGLAAHECYLSEAPYADLKVFAYICQHTPEDYHLQSGNSSVVRYFQLFDRHWQFSTANRGTSGIEGSLSTAVGYALRQKAPVLCVLGDLSFQYDLHALWQKSLPPHLRIIVINNGGGGIFRYIAGPESMRDFESYFEAHHSLTAASIAAHYGVNYLEANVESEVVPALQRLFDPNVGCTLLEIFTPRLDNARILKEYFEFVHTYSIDNANEK
jgi:2-succinyl-5-enolpyruvyl-6-hydroxy-3-cyclohexene-1-carboxylate synthase